MICYKRKFNLLLILGLMLLCPSKYVQSADQSLIQEKQWEQLKGDHEYSEKIPVKKPEKKKELKRKSKGVSVFNFDFFLKILAYAAIVILLIGAVYLIIKRMGLFDKLKTDTEKRLFEQTVETMPLERELQQMLNRAIEEKDLRSAIHLLYILMLIKMHHKKWLVFAEGKSPGQFLSEITESSTKAAFGEIILVYERTWFGDFPIDENSWNNSLKLYQKTIEVK